MAPDAPLARDLAWDACYNARDLGGYLTAAGAAPATRAQIRTQFLLPPAGVRC